uniref:RRM domain-containing protein n=1 Tax=Ditylenchus dipsaci TaxID=166011 RepID=A0A915EPF2_9BILA
MPFKTRFRMIVENLTTRYSWQDLKDMMRQTAEVTFADAHRFEKNQGLVCFASRRDLERAIDKYQGKRSTVVLLNLLTTRKMIKASPVLPFVANRAAVRTVLAVVVMVILVVLVQSLAHAVVLEVIRQRSLPNDRAVGLVLQAFLRRRSPLLSVSAVILVRIVLPRAKSNTKKANILVLCMKTLSWKIALQVARPVEAVEVMCAADPEALKSETLTMIQLLLLLEVISR